MALLANLLTPWRRKGVDGSLELFRSIYGGMLSKTGEPISYKSALQVSTVLACVRVICEGVAQVPWKLYQESPDGRSRLPLKTHQLYRVLHRRPNPWQTSFEFRETIIMHLVLCGNAFVFINRLRGQIVELIAIEPQRVTVNRADDGTLSYRVSFDKGSAQDVAADAIWHLRGPSWNGWMGLEAVQLAREAIGLAMATETAHANLHRNGIRPSGAYSVEGTLSAPQYKALRDFLDENHKGENEGRAMILDRNAKWLSMSMTGVDAQHLETRRFQIEEVCRAFRVMPIMVGYSDKSSTYASAEQMFLAHVVHTITPWAVRLEQSADTNLITDREEAAGIYTKLMLEGLMRGAMKDTAEYLVKLRLAGIMTGNECRSKLELNPLDGLDEPLTPSNMTVGAGDDPEPEPKPEPADAGA